MKTIGLIGGMSWESTLEYYRIINETVKARLGGFHSARCTLVSLDFAEIEALQREERWPEQALILQEAARSLESAGADFIVLCTNTMHKLAEDISEAVRIPLLHIADAAARQVQDAGLRKVGLLGTRFTMEQDFYRERLERHRLTVLIPGESQRELIHRVIYDELCLGLIRESSRADFAEIISDLVKHGAQGIILGCTEIELLVRSDDSLVPVFPTTRIHAEAAVDFALRS
jgi:aspartate racemase